MEWKPNKWAAAILALVCQPLGLLYAGRPRWALVCIAVLVAIAWVGLFVALSTAQYAAFNFSVVAVAILGVAAAFVGASSYRPRVLRPRYTRWYVLLAALLCFVLSVVFFRAFFLELFRMPANSMLPTMVAGTGVIAKKWGYGNYGTFGVNLRRTRLTAEMSRGDIFVFEHPKRRSVLFLKRLIGLPGDTVAYKDKRLSINGQDVPVQALGDMLDVMGGGLRSLSTYEETMGETKYAVALNGLAPAIMQSAIQPFPMQEKCAYDPSGFICTVPPGHYFMMGDNRDNSDDSRYWGFVPENAIAGKVVSILPKNAAFIRGW
jgi:signal peptidase I